MTGAFGSPSDNNWAKKAESIGEGVTSRLGTKLCIYRERPVNPGDNVFFPASFPPIEAEGPMPVSDGLDLPPDDLEEIHSILVKTTTMLFKMLWIERTHQLNRENVAKPRQVFVTKSRVLAGKVEEYFLKLLNSLKIASQSPQALKKLVEAKKSNSDTGLVDQDDDENWRSDLPARFSELQDSHFPLFTTFDRLCDLIEGDFNSSETLYNRWQNGTPRTFVSFDHFRANYWPHFSQALTKGLDPAMVFSEIIGQSLYQILSPLFSCGMLVGIIKGSEDTLSSPYRYLDRKVYQQLSERTQYTFATQRSAVYSIFEAYQGRKRQQGDFDAADR
ncbi:hypothetical protein DXG01_005717 [Tephrocybe rancida]|nr:hypothetical protein DXG01_005717 [Tephrocybe rancida]